MRTLFGSISSVLMLAFAASAAAAPAATAPVSVSPETEAWAKAWVRNLHEMGVRAEGDSLYVSEDARRVMTDAKYRKLVYPETYRWEAVQRAIKARQMKIAFWYLINLYEADAKYRQPALQMMAGLDGPLEMDRVLLGTFYTYGLLDPRVCSLKDGHPEVTRPDLAEKRLGVVKEIIEKIAVHRKAKRPAVGTQVGALPGGGR